MGGQACVFYGAAEFSRDLDLLILAERDDLAMLTSALAAHAAKVIAVPPFEMQHLAHGYAVHFRCYREDVAGLRIDLMSSLWGIAPFEELWARRTTKSRLPAKPSIYLHCRIWCGQRRRNRTKTGR
jgi:hypothetical protein